MYVLRKETRITYNKIKNEKCHQSVIIPSRFIFPPTFFSQSKKTLSDLFDDEFRSSNSHNLNHFNWYQFGSISRVHVCRKQKKSTRLTANFAICYKSAGLGSYNEHTLCLTSLAPFRECICESKLIWFDLAAQKRERERER